jgi:phosphatidylglycerol lysyltransferase
MLTRRASTRNNSRSSYPSSRDPEDRIRGLETGGQPLRHMTGRLASGAVRIAAVLTAAMGIVNVFSSLTPAMANRLRVVERYSPLEVQHGGHFTAALAGFALLLLAGALWRRKRVAWLLTVLVLVGSAVAHVMKGFDYEEAGLAAVLCGLLLALRPQFHARSDPPSIRQAFSTLVAAILFTLAYGTAGFFLLDRHFRVTFGLGAAVRQTIVMFTQYYDPGLEPVTGFGRYFADSIYLVAVVTTGYSLLLLIRPVLAPRRASDADRRRAAQVVRDFGQTSLAPLTLLPDKLYYFSPAGSAIAYVVKGRVALALGDPIGPPRDTESAIRGFQASCSPNDWFPVFYQVLPDHLRTYARAGFQHTQIGQEAIIDLGEFTLQGGERKSIRTAVNKMTRLGYTAHIFQPPHPESILQELQAVSDEWLAERRSSEMRFSVGWFDRDYLDQCPLLVVVDPGGQIEAFANILTLGRGNETTADLMRHRSGAASGQMDFLFASLLDWAKQQGFERFSFGLSGLAGTGEHPGDPAIERALGFAFRHLNQFYNFKGLHAYKAKFGPVWEPRYLVYPDLSSLPASLGAFIRANTGDDLLGGYLFHPR